MSKPYIRLTGMEALFLRMDRGSSYQHTLKIVILDPTGAAEPWSFEGYRMLLARHVEGFPFLRMRYMRTPLNLHQPVWVEDPRFTVGAHMCRIACPSPGTMREFCAVVEQIYAHVLDHSRPLWQVWAIEGLQDGKVGLVTLIHHAYSDGVGMRGVLEALGSPEPQNLPESIPAVGERQPLPSAARRVMWALRDMPALLRSVPLAIDGVRERRRLEREFFSTGRGVLPTGADRRRPQPFGGLLTRERRFACESFLLEQIREVRAAFGVTVNDVFLACVAGSVREFLIEQGEPCNEPMVTTMAFVYRLLGERERPGGNFSSADDLWLHIEIADPVERLRVQSASATATKSHYQALMSADPFVLVDLIPGSVAEAALRLDERTKGRISPGCNLVVSNVPGPKETIYFGPWKMDSWFSTGQLMHGLTLNVTAWSYAGQFNICILSASDRVPDAWDLMDGLRSALDTLAARARDASGAQAGAAQ